MLLANMWSLLNFEAHDIFAQCAANDIKVIVGGPFSSGILATGADPADGSCPFYNYTPADSDTRARCREIEAACTKHGIPLIAAALQFPLLHPVVSCVIPGGKNPREIESNIEMMNVNIPVQFWYELQQGGLLPLDCPLPELDSGL